MTAEDLVDRLLDARCHDCKPGERNPFDDHCGVCQLYTDAAEEIRRLRQEVE